MMVKELEEVVVRFSGDSGDGMQLAGNIFSNVSATVGNDICTFPDYPADIRAPQGSLTGVSGFQVHIGAGQVFGETYAFSRETLMVDAVAAQQTDILFWNLDILVHTPHPASTWQPKFIRNLLQISLRKNLALSQRIFCTTPKTIRGRLLVYLSNQAAKAGSNYFKIPFDRQGLADYLNVDRSALSKELGKMRDEGILTTRKNAFTLYGLSHEPLLYVSFSKAFH